ncbi:MAG: outer membrane protein assembly factor BamA [Pontiellaceae bacterium]|nr:outer membrane protein assembly factor BamA [Pontiellaceae bacterium]
MKLFFRIFILLLVVTSSALAQQKMVTITQIRIENLDAEQADVSTVSAYSSFEVGQTFDADTLFSLIAVDVNRMRESGQYSYVEANALPYGDGMALVYKVATKPRLIGVQVQGAEKIGNRKLLKKAELEVGTKVDDSVLERAALKIEEACRYYWYPDAKVTWEDDVDEELNTTFVTFTVEEGSKLGIKRIEIKGNEHFKDSTLRKLLEQKDTRWHSKLTRYGQYKEEVQGLDIFSLQTFYMNQGYLDVVVHEPELERVGKRSAELVYTIEEGQRYVIGDVVLTGMKAVDEADLREMISLKKGTVASNDNIDNVSEALRKYYGDQGYISASIRSIRHADEATGVVDIEYVISEGAVGYINRINISGNEWTSDKVIRRELLVYPAEKYHRGRVLTSENILRNLNLFDNVSITPEPVGDSGKYDLNVLVKETNTGNVSSGISLSSIDLFFVFVEYYEGNFSFKQWPPKGDGQKLKIRAQLGTKRSDVELNFVEPWFLDRRLSLGVDLYHRDSSYYSSQYDLSTDGFRVSLGRPITRFFGLPVGNRMRGTVGYSLEQYDVYDVNPLASAIIRAEEGTRSKSTLDYTLLFDNRNYTYLPTKGNMSSLTPYVSGGPLGGQTDLYGLRLRSSQFLSLPESRWVLNLRGAVNSVEAFGDSKNSSLYADGVPLFDRQFLGGQSTLRGFDYRDVGPQDSGQPVGGNTSAYASLELSHPIWQSVRGAVFYDCGFVNKDSWDFDTSSYHDDWGVGIRLDMALPLQIDVAWPITYDDSLSGKPQINFNLSRSF